VTDEAVSYNKTCLRDKIRTSLMSWDDLPWTWRQYVVRCIGANMPNCEAVY